MTISISLQFRPIAELSPPKSGVNCRGDAVWVLQEGELYDRPLVPHYDADGFIGWSWADCALGNDPPDYPYENGYGDEPFEVTHWARVTDVNSAIAVGLKKAVIPTQQLTQQERIKTLKGLDMDFVISNWRDKTALASCLGQLAPIGSLIRHWGHIHHNQVILDTDTTGRVIRIRTYSGLNWNVRGGYGSPLVDVSCTNADDACT